jgi:hypothetical protein
MGVISFLVHHTSHAKLTDGSAAWLTQPSDLRGDRRLGELRQDTSEICGGVLALIAQRDAWLEFGVLLRTVQLCAAIDADDVVGNLSIEFAVKTGHISRQRLGLLVAPDGQHGACKCAMVVIAIRSARLRGGDLNPSREARDANRCLHQEGWSLSKQKPTASWVDSPA